MMKTDISKTTVHFFGSFNEWTAKRWTTNHAAGCPFSCDFCS